MSSSISQKRCSKCGQSKPATSEYFHRTERGLYGLKSICKTCQSEYSRNRNANPDIKIRSHLLGKEWRKNNREKVCAKGKRYYHKHAEKIRAKAKLTGKEIRKRYNDKHPGNNSKTRARRAKADGFHTSADVILQLKSQKAKCWWCGKKLKGKKYHVDHIIPLSRGGTNWPNNIVISCPFCNLSKGNKLPSEWIGKLI